MKRMRSKKLNSVLIAGALSASIVLGGVGATLMNLGSGNTAAPAFALDSNYTINAGTGKTYYVAPGVARGEGSGTESDPYELWWILSQEESPLAAGDTVLVKPGVYNEFNRIRITQKSGEFNNYITVKNASKTEKAVIDFSDMPFGSTLRGVQIDTDFWHWQGIDICGAGDNGMYIGGSYNVIENCEFYRNRDTGLQLGRPDGGPNHINDWPSYNLIKNCTSYNNYDNETYGENADGFAAKLTVGYGNIFDGCIAYRNSDDGWDLFAKVDSGNIGAVIMYNCVAFENGYIAETQEEFHKHFKNYNTEMNEVNMKSYLTKDGDGNGFKLGGSVMEGDVFMYNCLSFNNRMHGVTDNSNPGVLSVSNTTVFNNSAGIDDNPSSPTFGQIISDGAGISSDGQSGNINMARHATSYNLFSRILSVNSGLETVAPDEYRGSAEYCYFDLVSGKANKIGEVVDASSIDEPYAQKGEKVDSIKADIFAKLPVEWADAEGGQNVYNLSGKGNSNVHKLYRNADGSINMGDMLRITDYTKLFGNDNKIGCDLTKTSWDQYEHFGYFNASNAESKEDAAVKSAIASLYINTNINATFQDFDLLVGMEDVTISWESSDPEKIAINTDTPTSPSGTHDARAIVYRCEKDEVVTLTATVTSTVNKEISMTRVFPITLKKDVPTIGDSIFEGVKDGSIIIDQFSEMEEPAMTVLNAADYNGKLLPEDMYSVETTVRYAAAKGGYGVEIHHFTTHVAGVYTMEKKIILGESSETRSYNIFVASSCANVNFVGQPLVTVNQHGFTISGEVSSPIGKLYAISSKQPLTDISPSAIMSGGKGYEFRADNISFQFDADNGSPYYIYYVLCNMIGEATSPVGTVAVQTKDINNIADFKSMMLENNSSTIYMLKSDLDLSGETNWVSEITSQKKKFIGLFNGLGHTIKNFTVEGKADEEAALFYRLEGGTVENVKFENFNITNKANKVGIFATSYGGYIYNVSMKNIRVTGAQRVAALIGQIMNGELHVDQVSLVNDARYEKAEVTEADFEKNIYYVLDGSEYKVANSFMAGTTYYLRSFDLNGERCGAIGGDLQASSATSATQTYISNIYVDAVIGPDKLSYHGSIIGRNDDRNAKDRLEIRQCFSRSVLYGKTYVGGIIGSGNNTGAGVLRVDGCAFIGDLYYSQDNVHPLTASVKNCSGIVGRYSSVADALVTDCYAKFEDNNSNHDVESETFGIGGTVYSTVFTDQMGFSGDKWVLYMKEGSVYDMVEPYATLKFLGNWD